MSRRIAITARGHRLVFELGVEALSAYLEETRADKARAARRLVRATVEDKEAWRALSESAPTLYVPVADKILDGYGIGATLTVLDPDELDAEMAAAFAAEERRNAGSVLRLVAVTGNADGVPVRLIMRTPTERETDDHTPRERDVAACEALVRALACWGPLDRFPERPGLWVVLSGLAMAQAGLEERLTVGEA